MDFSAISIKDIPKEMISNLWSTSLERSERVITSDEQHSKMTLRFLKLRLLSIVFFNVFPFTRHRPMDMTE